MSEVHVTHWAVAANHPALAGHFPGQPIVPGVVLLERVAAALRDWRGQQLATLDAKFLRPLLPGSEASIELSAVGESLRFEVRGADGNLVARGTLAARP